MSRLSGLTANVDRRGSCSPRGAPVVACGAVTGEAGGGAAGSWGLLAMYVAPLGDGEVAIGVGGSGGLTTARPSRERFAATRGASLSASTRTRLGYVRRAATETGTPRSESIAATAVQLYPFERSDRIWGDSVRIACCLLTSVA